MNVLLSKFENPLHLELIPFRYAEYKASKYVSWRTNKYIARYSKVRWMTYSIDINQWPEPNLKHAVNSSYYGPSWDHDLQMHYNLILSRDHIKNIVHTVCLYTSTVFNFPCIETFGDGGII